MLVKVGSFFSAIVRKYLPDAFIFAIFLTLITFILGMILTESSPIAMVAHWGDGVWKLLTFTMQIGLTLVTSHILAHTKPVQKLLKSVTSKVKKPASAIMIAVVSATIASYLSWAFGLIVGGIVAKELAKQVKGVHYPLLVGSAYTGFIVWHAGLSGSIPLAIATPGHFLEEKIGLIPVTETMFSIQTIVTVLILFITMPFVMRFMIPKDKHEIIELKTSAKEEMAAATGVPASNETKGYIQSTWATKVENNRFGSVFLGLLFLSYLIYHFYHNGGLTALNLDVVNGIFFAAGLLFVESPRRYVEMAGDAGRSMASIVIQFPLYAGIMGMMVGSGLAVMISTWFVQISDSSTLPLFSFWAAGLLNIFVPSGGGQWAVQGPIMIQAAQEIGSSIPEVAMAIAWGDAWTNMIQPFWALPLLGIAGLGIRDIMGYCVVALFWSGIVISAMFMLF
jgi:short-chain fatty acids transporter